MDTVLNTENIGLKTLFTIGFILLLNTLASFFYWYSTIWWFDIFMHFFGGFFASLFAVWLYGTYFSPILKTNTTIGSILLILCVVFVIGLGWEIYEIAVDYYTKAFGYVYLDGISDLFNDIAGGCVGITYLLKDKS